MRNRLAFSFVAVIGLSTLLMAGCQRTHIPDSHQKPAVPPFVSEKPSFSPLEQRTIDPEEVALPFTVKTDLTPIQRAVRAAVPERIPDRGEARSVTESPVVMEQPSAWTFIRQGEPRIKMQDGLVVTHATYLGEPTSVTVPETCRANPVQVTVDSTGEIRYEQQAERILARYVPMQVTVGQPASSPTNPMPSCELDGLGPTESAERWFQPSALKRRLSDSTDAEGIALPVGQIWSDVSKPVAVSTPTMNSLLCFYTQPAELVLGKPQGTVEETVLHGFVKHTPTVSFEKECRHPQRHAVTVSSSTDLVQSSKNDPYRVLGVIPVPYNLMEQSLQKKMFHQTIRLEQSEPVVVESVTASDAKGRVLLSVDLSGGLSGTVYYWGTPQLQSNGRVVRIPDLEMAQESKRALDTFRLGYWQIVDHQLKEQLREAAVVDVGPHLDAMKRGLTGQHKAGSMTIDMLVAQHHPQQVRTTPDGLVVYSFLEGTASAAGRLPLERTTRRENLSEQILGEAPATIGQSDR